MWKIAFQGPCYMTLLMIAFGLFWGHLLQIRPTQSVFVSTCLSLSSTPLVSRFLMGSARGEKEGRWGRAVSMRWSTWWVVASDSLQRPSS